MPGRLVEQLLDTGLITGEQARASDADDPLVSPSRVIQNLVAEGLDERILAGFFVSQGFGPVLHAAELGRADRELVRRLPATDAHDLCAMPLRPSPAGAIVAMANPTDERAVERLRESLGPRILPTVAKLSDLLDAIDRAYPPDRPTLVTDPRALVGARTPSGVVSLSRQEIGASPDPTWSDPPLSDLASTASPVWDRAWNASPTERDLPTIPRSGLPPEPVPPLAEEDSLDAELAPLTRATTRDEAVRIACRACLCFARGGAFLALRKGVFRGWDGVGEDVTRAGIRSLWVPASNPSILNEVLHSGEAFQGAYGETAADHLFRAAMGSRGRGVAVVPVLIGSRMVGVLCADDPAGGISDIERVGQALAEAFERLIISRKSRN
ncbi:MAG: hypothetical protein WAU39_12985 [Polyangiales bacterium]